ncbi:DMT family transporter [Sporolactobacillus shoreae]|uniref:DMT family transporter n=1 Tax=Sporolactobacillus shoreae TaxID=1465501 RepID=A0A4Z0GQS5_9BACL|nr:DMT family transporter [Sporolactobacillus shoreae]TGA98924.1 DMT family transporter [Sporolactobacillus shoreae]
MDGEKFFTNKKVVIVLAVFCCILWGSAYPGVKIGYSLFQISTGNVFAELSFAGYRFIIAGLMVLILALMMSKKLFTLTWKNIESLILLGLTQTTLQYVFFYIGLAHTTGLKASIMNGTSAFFSVILAHFLYRDDRINFSKAVGCILGFLGVLLVNFSSDLLSFNFKIIGEGFVAVAAFAFSASAIYGKRICQRMDSVIVTGYQLLIGGVVLLLMGISGKGYVAHFTFGSTLVLLYLGLLSALAFTLWTILLNYNKVGPISVYNFLIPVSGAILSAIFLGENIYKWENAVALVLVCTGIYAVNRQGHPLKKHGRASSVYL